MIFYITRNPTRLHGTQADAKAVSKNFEQIDIPTDKAGLMTFVQELYTEIDAGPRAHPDLPDAYNIADPALVLPPPTEPKSLDWDDGFEQLPLARQLHFAAIAMENARERL